MGTTNLKIELMSLQQVVKPWPDLLPESFLVQTFMGT